MPEPTFEWVDINLIVPNPWNPNAMEPEMYGKAIESIHEFGFVDPVTVRTTVPPVTTKVPNRGWIDVVRYEIIDGEHRWKAGKDHGDCVRAPKGGGWERHHGLSMLPIANLGPAVSDEVAKQLTIVLNETRGTYDPKRMGELLIELVAIKPLAQLTAVLPFDKAKIEELAELPSVDWEDVRFQAKRGAATGGERMVERVFRLPVEVAEALDRAIRQCREDDGSSDAEAIRTIAEVFLRA